MVGMTYLGPADFDLPVVSTWIGLCDQVPVGLGIEVLTPSTSHLHILHVFTICPGLNEQNGDMWIFS